MVRAGTKYFLKKNALKAKSILSNKGVSTRIVKTTKIKPLSGKKKKAFLVKRS